MHESLWPEDAPQPPRTFEDLERLAADAETATDDSHVDISIWPTLPVAALYGFVGEVVKAIAPHTEADPAAILIQLLAAAGNLCGPGPYCRVGATFHHINLYAVLVGETSKGRKGTSWDHVSDLCGRVDSRWAADRVTGGLSSSEGLIAEVQDGCDPLKDRRLQANAPWLPR